MICMRAQAASDGAVGWLTCRDRNGVACAEPEAKLYSCLQSVAITDAQDAARHPRGGTRRCCGRFSSALTDALLSHPSSAEGGWAPDLLRCAEEVESRV